MSNDDLTALARATGVLHEPDPFAAWRARVEERIDEAGQALADEVEDWLGGGAR